MNLEKINIKIHNKLTSQNNKMKYAEKLLEKNEYLEAIKILENIQSTSDRYFYKIGSAYYGNEQYRKAIEAFEKMNEKKFNRLYARSLSKATYYHKAVKYWDDRFEECSKLKKKIQKQDYIDAIITNYLADNDNHISFIKLANQNYNNFNIWDSFALEENWNLAIYCLESSLDTMKSIDLSLYHKLAKWYINTFEYEKARTYLNKYLEEKQSEHIIILLSIVEERLGNNDYAIELLEQVNITEHPNKVNLGYRLGNLYMEKKDYQLAAKIFDCYKYEKIITNEVVLANLYYQKAEVLKEQDQFDKAIEYYIKVINTYRGHFSPLYSQIGHLLFLKGKYKQSCEYFKQYNISDKFYGFDSKVMPKHSRVSYYIEQFESLPIDDSVILYCAYNGNAFYGNLLAMYKYYKNEPNLKHFIVLKNINNIPIEIREADNVYIVLYASRLHYRLLAMAKYVFTNGTYPFEYIRKQEQVALNTWHGTPIKTLGFDVSNSSFSISRNIINSYYSSTHIIHPNEATKNAIIKSFALKNGEMHHVTGYPRQDFLINSTTSQKHELKKKLGLELSKPVVLYATTVRDGDSVEVEKNELMQIKAIQLLSDNPLYNFLYKGHYSKEESDEINKIDSNELLSIVDILITDYSSIAIDYLVCNKPIILFTYDIKGYREKRGFYFEPTTLTSNVANHPEEIPKMISSLLTKHRDDDKQIAAKSLLCSNDDGEATLRIDKLLNTTTKYEKSKQRLLIFAGNIFLINGITSSFKNLIDNINFEKYKVYILLTQNSFSENSNEQILTRLREKGCSFVFYYGAISASRVERYAYTEFNKNMYFYNEYHKNIYESAMKRTSNRIFGNLKFDKILNFESGYSRDVSNMLALTKAKEKYIVLHSDMKKEQELRFPHLKCSFEYWKHYDQVLSVSNAINVVNHVSVGIKYGCTTEKFNVFLNYIDIEEIINKGKEKIEGKEKKLFNNKQTFVCVGRLSIEKNQTLLIEAFAKARKKTNLNMNLIIIGDGPMRSKLQKQIKSLGMKKYITLLGFKQNPYKYISKSHCLISPSLQEGQGLVLLEALLLNTEILATKVPASIEIVNKYGGEICEFDSCDMSEKILEISGHRKTSNNFDPFQYNIDVKKKASKLI